MSKRKKISKIKIENIKLPYGFNKNFIEAKNDKFIINSNSGGEFFPNKEIIKIVIVNVIFLFLGLVLFAKLYAKYISLLAPYSIFLVILTYTWINLTNIKTTFTFSSKGLDIHSKKGSLFIPKENIKKIIKFQYTKYGSSRHQCYNIICEFYENVNIPYTKLNKNKVTLFDSYYDIVNDKGKILICYIIQEIKKALDFNM